MDKSNQIHHGPIVQSSKSSKARIETLMAMQNMTDELLTENEFD